MRRIGIILALVTLAGVSSGAFDFLHRQQHARQSAQWLAAMSASATAHHQPLPTPPSNRDESNCPICLTLHLPFTPQMAQTSVAALALLTIAIATRPATVTVARIPLPIICRGPPAL